MKTTGKCMAVLGVLAGVFVLTWFVYFPHSPLGRQEANLKLAEQHKAAVEKRLENFPGITNLLVGRYTGFDGCLSVRGTVSDQATIEVVMREVLATQPPVGVNFEFKIADERYFFKFVEPHQFKDARVEPADLRP